MDITEALAPTSDQLDAIELATPRTFTIGEGSRRGVREGKVVAEIALADFPRVWRPSKGMLDVLAAIWGTNATEWIGRSVTLYNDPDVTFGKERVGGIRISHMTNITEPTTVQIRGRGQNGRKIPWTVQPLIEEARPDYATQVAEATTKDALNGIWRDASTAGHLDDTLKAAILARGGELVDDTQEGDK